MPPPCVSNVRSGSFMRVKRILSSTSKLNGTPVKLVACSSLRNFQNPGSVILRSVISTVAPTLRWLNTIESPIV